MKKSNTVLIILIVIISIGVGFIYYKSTHIDESQQKTLLVERNNYQDYSQEKLLSAVKKGKVVLFFAATSWCSTCSELDKAIKGNYSKLPQDITILKVDYDRDQEMRRKYAVTMQTTLILLDSTGNEVKRWVSGDFNKLLSELAD